MKRLNTVLKAVSALAVLAAFIFVSGTTGIAGTDSAESNAVSLTTEKSGLALNKVSSEGRSACGAGKCGGSEKKADMKAKTADAKESAKEMKKSADCEGGKCGDGKCGGSEKKADMKAKTANAKDKVKEVKKEGKCGS